MTTGGLMAIFAHPDDETFGVGGTMAHYADRGIPITMVCATRGEVGEIAPGTGATPETLGAFREQELRDAMAILGVADVRFLEFRDSGMQGTPENDDPRCLHRAAPDAVVEPLVRMIRERRPDIVVTWDESGGYGHPDHVAIHHHATAAYHAAADGSRYPRAGASWQARALFYNVIPIKEWVAMQQELRARGLVPDEPPGGNEGLMQLRRVPANCVVDVSGQYARKKQALRAHRTQISDDDIFLRLPEDLAAQFFGREWFHRADPPLAPKTMLSDLTEGLD
jgi:LmbE family N-acetylglucosaminyl deacetylase